MLFSLSEYCRYIPTTPLETKTCNVIHTLFQQNIFFSSSSLLSTYILPCKKYYTTRPEEREREKKEILCSFSLTLHYTHTPCFLSNTLDYVAFHLPRKKKILLLSALQLCFSRTKLPMYKVISINAEREQKELPYSIENKTILIFFPHPTKKKYIKPNNFFSIPFCPIAFHCIYSFYSHLQSVPSPSHHLRNKNRKYNIYTYIYKYYTTIFFIMTSSSPSQLPMSDQIIMRRWS